jgi:hypothetical protein
MAWEGSASVASMRGNDEGGDCLLWFRRGIREEAMGTETDSVARMRG